MSDEREQLVTELSALSLRMLHLGGAAEIAAHAAALVEGAAAALPPEMLAYFAAQLLARIESGARMAGHAVTFDCLTEPLKSGRLH